MDNIYVLKHKNTDVALMRFDGQNQLEQFSTVKKELLPYLGNDDAKEFHIWWDNRAIPKTRQNLNHILNDNNCSTPTEFIINNLALSLNDCYWICPQNEDLQWEDVNLFNSINDPIIFTGNKETQYSPNSTLGGNLDKKWLYENGIWNLHKKNETHDGQQSVNEKFACMIHSLQGFTDFIPYTLTFENGICNECICPSFTNENKEFISGYGVVSSEKKSNDISMYDHFVNICAKYGLNKKEVQEFMDYQTLSDYLISNTDRHFNNFGILRDPNTLHFVGMAPIFDSGNSMFYKDTYAESRIALTQTSVTGFVKKEPDILKYIKNKNILDTAKIPSEKDVREFMVNNGIEEQKSAIISKNYQLKVELLKEFQKGYQISLYNEKKRISEIAVKTQVILPDMDIKVAESQIIITPIKQFKDHSFQMSYNADQQIIKPLVDGKNISINTLNTEYDRLYKILKNTVNVISTGISLMETDKT